MHGGGVTMSDSEKRIELLEARIAAIETTLAALAEQRSTPGPASSAALQPPPPSGAPIEATRPLPAASRQAIELDSEALLKWGGVGLVVLAVGFGVSTAIQRGWIGPMLQLAGALVLAFALIGIGIRLESTRRAWTHALCSGGVAVLFVIFASDLFLDLANTDVAFSLTFVSGLAGVGFARFVRSEWVGIVTLLGGVTGWLVVGEGDPPFTESGAVFVTALIVLTLVAVEQQWFGLRTLTGLIGLGCGLALAATADTGIEHTVSMVGAGSVAVILLVVPSLGDDTPPWRPTEFHVPTLLAPWAWVVLASSFIDNIDAGAGLVAFAVAGAVAGFAVSSRARLAPAHLVALLVGASVTVTIGAGATLSTEVAWVAAAVQGVGLLVLRRILPGAWLLAANAAALLFAAALSVFVTGHYAWNNDATIGDDIANLAVIVVIGVAGWIVRRSDVRVVVAFAVLGLSLLWLGSVFVHLPQGQAVVSLSWAVVGVAILVAGAVRKIPKLGNVGLGVLALTVGKLLLVDMAEVDALWRAGLFFAVGLSLLRLGFVLPRWTDAADSAPAES